MSKPARGTKRVCPSCGARFYDLNRTPIVCPVCQSVYQVTPLPTRRGERAQPVETRTVEEPEAEAPVLEGPEIISLEEAEEGSSDVPAEEDEEIVDLGEDAAEIPAGDDENAFLEEEEEGEADVSGIVGGDKNEEG
ncbi:MAG TPA: TIGR02300 family protein [Methyloceanibacter sp.]|nr:TIGR02300 family protein [Methyloceanibacter sp.]